MQSVAFVSEKGLGRTFFSPSHAVAPFLACRTRTFQQLTALFARQGAQTSGACPVPLRDNQPTSNREPGNTMQPLNHYIRTGPAEESS